jgi:hypothetical protein
MPILMRTPDITADTWLGALACAGGSQTWNGITPALMPKATRASRNSTLLAPRPMLEGATAARSKDPVRACSAAKVASSNRKLVPRYTHPASRTSDRPSSVVTRKNADSVITSNAIKKSTASRAMRSVVIAPARSPRKTRTRAALSGCAGWDQ